MAISNYQSGKTLTTVPIGAGVDGAGYDPVSADVFASNADGTLTVIHQDSPDRYSVTQTLQTSQGSRNMGLDATNHRIFIAGARFGPPPSNGRGRPPVLPDSFSVLVVERNPQKAGARIDLSKYPAAVRTTIEAETRTATLKSVSKETEQGKTRYEVE